LGHLAVQFASAMGHEVTALSSSLKKREEALALGASRFLYVKDHAALNQMAYYFDLRYMTAHGGVAWGKMLDILRKRGKLILSGFSNISFSSVDLVVHELCVSDSFLGTQEGMREMLKFSVLHHIQPKIELMPMSQANQAIEKLQQGQSHWKKAWA